MKLQEIIDRLRKIRDKNKMSDNTSRELSELIGAITVYIKKGK